MPKIAIGPTWRLSKHLDTLVSAAAWRAALDEQV